jgi:hypothetical protein
VVGASENPTLAPNQIITGGDSPHLRPGTELWQGDSQPPVPAQGTTGMPSIATTAPALGSTVSGTVDVVANIANRPAGTVTINDDVYVNGEPNMSCELDAPPFRCAWDTTKAADGAHYLLTSIYDGAKNLVTWEYVAVIVKNH